MEIHISIISLLLLLISNLKTLHCSKNIFQKTLNSFYYDSAIMHWNLYVFKFMQLCNFLMKLISHVKYIIVIIFYNFIDYWNYICNVWITWKYDSHITIKCLVIYFKIVHDFFYILMHTKKNIIVTCIMIWMAYFN